MELRRSVIDGSPEGRKMRLLALLGRDPSVLGDVTGNDGACPEKKTVVSDTLGAEGRS